MCVVKLEIALLYGSHCMSIRDLFEHKFCGCLVDCRRQAKSRLHGYHEAGVTHIQSHQYDNARLRQEVRGYDANGP